MFSKIMGGPENRAEGCIAPAPASWSITRRLTCLYTVSAFGLLVLATAFLYRELAGNLARENALFLANRIHALGTILRDSTPEDMEEELKEEEATLQPGCYERVLDETGITRVETSGMGDVIAAPLFPTPAGFSQTPTAGKEWKSPDGRSYLLMTAWTELGPSGGDRRLLQVALNVSQDDALIADYRRKIAMTLLFGILISAGMGVIVTRKGLHPLQEITKATGRITATQLHERIGTERWPKELTALAAAFDGMLNRLEDSFGRLSQFSADLAHELRTPINNLMGEAEVALTGTKTPEEYRSILESSLEEYAKLSRMIDNVLFLARAESPEARIERSVFDVRREIEAVREFHDAVAEEQGVEVSCHGEASLNADPALFRRAISNLLSNALQHTPQGGKVTLSVKQSDDRSVEVNVADTGVGISPEHLPRIFDRFYTVDRARSQNAHGTGLGLAILKSIVDLHGGVVTVRSEPAKGTAVTLRFPPQSPTSSPR